MFHQFLIGLHGKSYGAVRTNLLSQHPLGDLDRAYQTLIQEEQSRASSRDKPAENVHTFLIGAERGRGCFDRIDRTKLVCSHCSKRGTRSVCVRAMRGKEGGSAGGRGAGGFLSTIVTTGSSTMAAGARAGRGDGGACQRCWFGCC